MPLDPLHAGGALLLHRYGGLPSSGRQAALHARAGSGRLDLHHRAAGGRRLLVKRVDCRVDPAYPVLIGPLSAAARRELTAAARRGGWSPPAFILTDATVGRLYAAPVRRLFEELGFAPRVHTVPAGEESKSLRAYAELATALLKSGARRRSPLVALGGGVVGDLGGFAAATFARGIPWVGLPTTLLAMVDSSVGGKVAVNLPVAKNAVGAFHQPELVLANPEFLSSLPPREYASGLAEVLKAALLGDLRLLRLLEEAGAGLLDRPPELMGEVIARAVRVKAAVVAEDVADHGRRRILNLGHTFGHALEAVSGYGAWLHGEAVAAGLVAAQWLAWKLGFMDEAALHRLERLLNLWGLPIRMPGLDPEQIEATMGFDKKSQGQAPVFVVLRGLGDPQLIVDPPRELVRGAVAYILDAPQEVT
ncbi:MAG: 3-dehydroquinate synthase [Candidatus Eisenbacteria bacterium]|nr:3-dehydroquinate synthase [Candidatus Eisenbacteria bacterium]